jgi:ribosomal protein S18 acetylase RimI-like enzyme
MRRATESDLSDMAVIHKTAYGKDHFSARFSMSMLKDYYGYYLKYNDYCFTAWDDKDRRIGFIVAGKKTGLAMSEFVKEYKYKLILLTLISPKEWQRKISGFLQMFFPSKKSHFKSKANLRLLSIAVGAHGQGKGVGGQMIKAFDEELKKAGEHLYGLSVRNTNPRAVNFYEKNNFELEIQKSATSYFVKKLN